MVWTLVLIGGGAWLVSSILNKAMSGQNSLVFGKYPTNQLVTGLGILGLLLAPVFGPFAALISFASALGATGGVVSIMNQSGVRLLPQMGTQGAISGDFDDLSVAAGY